MEAFLAIIGGGVLVGVAILAIAVLFWPDDYDEMAERGESVDGR